MDLRDESSIEIPGSSYLQSLLREGRLHRSLIVSLMLHLLKLSSVAMTLEFFMAMVRPVSLGYSLFVESVITK